jgi:LacI family transcriptional regulator
VTIHEVARHASVSPMTVSRVINGESNVRDTTRELVLEAVRALNYRPNPAARVLAGARDTRIALIYSNPSASYLSELLGGRARWLAPHRRRSSCSTAGTISSRHRKRPRRKNSPKASPGVILPPPLCESKAIAAAFAARECPPWRWPTGQRPRRRFMRAHRRLPRRRAR